MTVVIPTLPLSITESEFNNKMFDFWEGGSFSKHVGKHVTHRAINKSNFTILNHPTNEVESDIYMFHVSIVLHFDCKSKRQTL